MFQLSSKITFYMYNQPTDMRKGIGMLSGLVINEMKRNPIHGEAFIFVNRSRNTMKILHAEGKGLVVYHYRLFEGTFPLPEYDIHSHEFHVDFIDLLRMATAEHSTSRASLPSSWRP